MRKYTQVLPQAISDIVPLACVVDGVLYLLKMTALVQTAIHEIKHDLHITAFALLEFLWQSGKNGRHCSFGGFQLSDQLGQGGTCCQDGDQLGIVVIWEGDIAVAADHTPQVKLEETLRPDEVGHNIFDTPFAWCGFT